MCGWRVSTAEAARGTLVSPAALKKQLKSPRDSGEESSDGEIEREFLVGKNILISKRKNGGRGRLFSRKLWAATSGGGLDATSVE
jgi:hypothetical protein